MPDVQALSISVEGNNETVVAATAFIDLVVSEMEGTLLVLPDSVSIARPFHLQNMFCRNSRFTL